MGGGRGRAVGIDSVFLVVVAAVGVGLDLELRSVFARAIVPALAVVIEADSVESFVARRDVTKAPKLELSGSNSIFLL